MISTTNFIKARAPVCYRVGKAIERIDFAINVVSEPPNAPQSCELLSVVFNKNRTRIEAAASKKFDRGSLPDEGKQEGKPILKVGSQDL